MSFELVTSHVSNIDLFWFLRMGELWKVIVCCRKDDGRTKAAGKAANNFNLRSWCCYGYVMFGCFDPEGKKGFKTAKDGDEMRFSRLHPRILNQRLTKERSKVILDQGFFDSVIKTEKQLT